MCLEVGSCQPGHLPSPPGVSHPPASWLAPPHAGLRVSYRDIKRVPKGNIQVSSCVLCADALWPKQATWLNPESVWEGMTTTGMDFGVEIIAAVFCRRSATSVFVLPSLFGRRNVSILLKYTTLSSLPSRLSISILSSPLPRNWLLSVSLLMVSSDFQSSLTSS